MVSEHDKGNQHFKETLEKKGNLDRIHYKSKRNIYNYFREKSKTQWNGKGDEE